MKKILVTGGAGFLGSHLCEKLLELGNEVLCLDNFFTGRKLNIAGLLANQKFEVIRHDITIPINLVVDEIYNLASPASPVHYSSDPVQTTRTNVHGAINMLELARHLDIKILQASTSEVYGSPQISPQVETYWGNVNPVGPRSCYDEGKRCAETLFFDFYRQYQVKIKIARIFNTYGPRLLVDDGRVISNFIVQCLKGEPVTVYGDGQQSRSFCYVDDMVEALIRLMGTEEEETGPFNLGNPVETSMLELAELIMKTTGTGSDIVFKSLPIDDPVRRKPDITRAEKILHWHPVINLKEGLRYTINYFKSMDLDN